MGVGARSLTLTLVIHHQPVLDAAASDQLDATEDGVDRAQVVGQAERVRADVEMVAAGLAGDADCGARSRGQHFEGVVAPAEPEVELFKLAVLDGKRAQAGHAQRVQLAGGLEVARGVEVQRVEVVGGVRADADAVAVAVAVDDHWRIDQAQRAQVVTRHAQVGAQVEGVAASTTLEHRGHPCGGHEAAAVGHHQADLAHGGRDEFNPPRVGRAAVAGHIHREATHGLQRRLDVGGACFPVNRRRVAAVKVKHKAPAGHAGTECDGLHLGHASRARRERGHPHVDEAHRQRRQIAARGAGELDFPGAGDAACAGHSHAEAAQCFERRLDLRGAGASCQRGRRLVAQCKRETGGAGGAGGVNRLQLIRRCAAVAQGRDHGRRIADEASVIDVQLRHVVDAGVDESHAPRRGRRATADDVDVDAGGQGFERALDGGGVGIVRNRRRRAAVMGERETAARRRGNHRLHRVDAGAAVVAGRDFGRTRAEEIALAGGEQQRDRTGGLLETDAPRVVARAIAGDFDAADVVQIVQRLLDLRSARAAVQQVGRLAVQAQAETALAGLGVDGLHLGVGGQASAGGAPGVLAFHRQPPGQHQRVAGGVHQQLRQVAQARRDEGHEPRIGLTATADHIDRVDIGQCFECGLEPGSADVEGQPICFLAVEAQLELSGHGGADGDLLHLVGGALTVHHFRDRSTPRQRDQVDRVVAAAGIDRGRAAGAVVDGEVVSALAERDRHALQPEVIDRLASGRQALDGGGRQAAGDRQRVGGVVDDQLVKEAGIGRRHRTQRRELAQRLVVAVIDRNHGRPRRIAVATVDRAVAIGIEIKLLAGGDRFQLSFHVGGAGVEGNRCGADTLVAEHKRATDRVVGEGLSGESVLQCGDGRVDLTGRAGDELRQVFERRFDEGDGPRRSFTAGAGDRDALDAAQGLQRRFQLVGRGIEADRIGLLATEHERERAARGGGRDLLDLGRGANFCQLQIARIGGHCGGIGSEVEHPRVVRLARARHQHARLEGAGRDQLLGEARAAPVAEQRGGAFVFEHVDFIAVHTGEQIRALHADPLRIRVQAVVVENLHAVQQQLRAVIAGGREAVGAGGRNEDRARQTHAEVIARPIRPLRERAIGGRKIHIRHRGAECRCGVEADLTQLRDAVADVEEIGLQPGLRTRHVGGFQGGLHLRCGRIERNRGSRLTVQCERERAAGAALVDLADRRVTNGRGDVHAFQILGARAEFGDGLADAIREQQRPFLTGLCDADIANAGRDLVVEIDRNDLTGFWVELGDVDIDLGAVLLHDRHPLHNIAVLAEHRRRVVDQLLEERFEVGVQHGLDVVPDAEIAVGAELAVEELDPLAGVRHLHRVIARATQDVQLTFSGFNRDRVVAATGHQGRLAADRGLEGEVVVLGIARAVKAQADVHVLDVLDQHPGVGRAVEGRAAGQAQALQAQVAVRHGLACGVIALAIVRVLDRDAAMRKRVLQRHASDLATRLLARDGDGVADRRRAEGHIVVNHLGEKARHRRQRALASVGPEVESDRRGRHAVTDQQTPEILLVDGAVERDRPAGFAVGLRHGAGIADQRLGDAARQAGDGVGRDLAGAGVGRGLTGDDDLAA